MKKQMISVVIPVYNEQANILPLWTALKKVTRKASNFSYEFLFVDDGSLDASLKEIKKIATKDHRVKSLEFVRNFGKEAATTAGLNLSKGDAVIMLDADLQHPVDLIPKFIRIWQDGAEVVTGVRNSNPGVSKFKQWRSGLFYEILNKISDTKLMANGTDYKLLDRIVVNEFNRLTERGRMTRGLISWLGFKTDYIYFDVNKRANGEPTYGTFKLIRLAINSFISLSLFPLKLTGYLGLFISAAAGLLGLFMLLERFVFNDALGYHFSGTAILAVMTMFLVGIILSALGLIALYIGAIHSETANRPLYIIRNSKNNYPNKK